MHLEEFARGNSFLHRIDPRVKFITATPYIFLIALITGINGPLIGLLFSIVMVLFADLNIRNLLNRLLGVNAFIFLLWIFLPFSYPGDAIFYIGALKATREGLLYVLSITLKANAIVIATIAILGTSELFSLAHAFVHFKVPKKLIHLFFFFYRYISVLHEEYVRLKRSITIRAFQPRTNMHTYRTYAYLVGMLIVRSYDRSQRIYQAMLCRGFKGKFPIMSHFEAKKGDVLFGLVMALMIFIIGLASRNG